MGDLVRVGGPVAGTSRLVSKANSNFPFFCYEKRRNVIDTHLLLFSVDGPDSC